MKNRRPMLADDCINLGVKIQLTDGDGVNVNFSYPVVIQALNGDRVIHSSKANIIVTKQPLPYLGVSFRLFNAKRIATYAFKLYLISLIGILLGRNIGYLFMTMANAITPLC